LQSVTRNDSIENMSRAALSPWHIGAESWSGSAGAWRVRARYGHPDGTKTAQGQGTTKGAARAALRANVDRARERHEDRSKVRGVDGKQKTSAYAAQWFARGKNSGAWSVRTIRQYEHITRVIDRLPIGRVPVANVTAGDVRDALTEVARERGAGAAKSTRSVLSGVLADAVERGARERNAVRDVDMARVLKVAKTTERKRVADNNRTLSTEALAGLLRDLRSPESAVGRAARGTRATINGDMADLITVWVALALRASEVRALRWSDVDLDAGTVAVQGTKTEDSTATLPLPKWAAQALRERQTAAMTDGTLSQFVFSGKDGGKRDASAVNRRLNAVLDAAGMTWARGHTLRKTAVTLAYETDGPIVAQRLARHADVRTTAAYYVKPAGDALKVSALDAIEI
jgi:integrase